MCVYSSRRITTITRDQRVYIYIYISRYYLLFLESGFINVIYCIQFIIINAIYINERIHIFTIVLTYIILLTLHFIELYKYEFYSFIQIKYQKVS